MLRQASSIQSRDRRDEILKNSEAAEPKMGTGGWGGHGEELGSEMFEPLVWSGQSSGTGGGGGGGQGLRTTWVVGNMMLCVLNYFGEQSAFVFAV